jgi:hypothetical protein
MGNVHICTKALLPFLRQRGIVGQGVGPTVAGIGLM